MEKYQTKSFLLSLFCDCFLCITKLFTGFIAHSQALISDAIHSCTDVFSNLIVLLCLHFKKIESSKTVRKFSPEKIEKAVLIFMSLTLIVTALTIAFNAVDTIINPAANIPIPEKAAFAVTVFAFITKEFLYFYNLYLSKKFSCNIIKANAEHHQSDALSCLASFFGILISRIGYPIFDPITGIFISILIIISAVKIIISTKS